MLTVEVTGPPTAVWERFGVAEAYVQVLFGVASKSNL